MHHLKFEVNPAIFQPMSDRFGAGYKDEIPESQCFELTAALKDVEGIGYCCPGQVTRENAAQYAEWIRKCGKKPGTIILNNWSKEFGWGSFTNKDEAMRIRSMEFAKECKDAAAVMGMDTITIWLANDGVDYVFQSDYFKAWDYMVSAFAEICDYRPEIRVAIEYKIKEPRIFQFISNCGDALDLISEVGKDNFGVALDLGHSLMAGEKMAYSVARILKKGRLFRTHWGDNFHHWDDDVIIGAANPLEFIEVVYWLRKGNWDGWCDLDIYPFKDNAKTAIEESVANVRAFESLVDYIGMSKMDELIEKDEPGCMVRTIREALFDFRSER